MKIHVTAEDIRKGVRSDCNVCPIALAVAREFGTADVHAGIFHIRAGRDRWSTPISAVRFIDRFDDGGAVEPFSFELAASPDFPEVAA